MNEKKDTDGNVKIILGKGKFGKVRLGLSLIENLSKPGEIIAIKKTHGFEYSSLKKEN